MILFHDSCYDCGVCTLMCEITDITIQMSTGGFLNPEINRDKCIKCNHFEITYSYRSI